MGLIIDKVSGNLLSIDIKEADLDTALKAKVNQGKIAGIITTTLPSTGIITDKVYEFAGVQGIPITGGTIKDTNGSTITTLQNGDSVWYNTATSFWYRIPFQSLSNYYTKTDIDTKLVSLYPFKIGTKRSDAIDSTICISNLVINFNTVQSAYDSNNLPKKLFISYLKNSIASNSIVRISDSTNYLCQFASTGNRTGVENITLSTANNSNMFATMTINWDLLLGQDYSTLNLSQAEIDPILILNAIQKISSIPYPLDDLNVFVYGTTNKIAFSNLEIFFKEPEKAYNSSGTLRRFYFDYLRNITGSNLFIRIQEVGNITSNGICFASLTGLQSGIVNLTFPETDNSGIYCKMTVDCNIFTAINNPSVTSSQCLIAEDVVLKGYQKSKYLGIEKIASNKFPLITNKIPKSIEKLTAMNDDFNIIVIGDSVMAKTNVTYGFASNKPYLPPHATTKNIYYNLFQNIVRNKPNYDRWDSVLNSFTETGAFTTTSQTEFDSPYWTGEVREEGELCRKSTAANASFYFSWNLNNYEKLNLIHRKGTSGTQAATLVITEGDNKAEILNDSGNWVEANGFIINQYINPSIATDGSGYCQSLGNWRTKLRRKTGATGSISITISKGNNSETLYYWGTERYNGTTVLMTNVARAGRMIADFQKVLLNDIYERNPDLILFEIPLLNEVSAHLSNEAKIYTDLQDLVWGDRLGFENANSFKTISNNWIDFECILIIPHSSGNWYTGNLPLIISNNLTALQVYERIINLIITKADLPYINMLNVMINEGRKRNRSIQETHTGINDVFFPFTSFMYDTAHPNDFGSRIWGEYISSIFYDII